MYPAITCKCVLSFTFWTKEKMDQPFPTCILSVCYFIVVIIVTMVTDRTNKLLVENRNEVVIKIYILIHASQQLCYAFIINSNCFCCFKNFSSFLRRFLIIIVGNSFG